MIYNDFPKKLEIFNQNSVLSCLKETPGDVSRAYVAKQVGLSRTTVSAAVNHLIDLELVQEVDKSSEPISRGRPACLQRSSTATGPVVWQNIIPATATPT